MLAVRPVNLRPVRGPIARQELNNSALGSGTDTTEVKDMTDGRPPILWRLGTRASVNLMVG